MRIVPTLQQPLVLPPRPTLLARLERNHGTKTPAFTADAQSDLVTLSPKRQLNLRPSTTRLHPTRPYPRNLHALDLPLPKHRRCRPRPVLAHVDGHIQIRSARAKRRNHDRTLPLARQSHPIPPNRPLRPANRKTATAFAPAHGIPPPADILTQTLDEHAAATRTASRSWRPPRPPHLRFLGRIHRASPPHLRTAVFLPLHQRRDHTHLVLCSTNPHLRHRAFRKTKHRQRNRRASGYLFPSFGRVGGAVR